MKMADFSIFAVLCQSIFGEEDRIFVFGHLCQKLGVFANVYLAH